MRCEARWRGGGYCALRGGPRLLTHIQLLGPLAEAVVRVRCKHVILSTASAEDSGNITQKAHPRHTRSAGHATTHLTALADTEREIAFGLVLRDAL